MVGGREDDSLQTWGSGGRRTSYYLYIRWCYGPAEKCVVGGHSS